MTTELQTPYQEMERADEGQILSELKGENFLEQFVYSYQQGTRTITSLSYTGIKEIVRRRRNFSIADFKVEETENMYRAVVKIHDIENNIDALGASEADKTKPFAYVLAINKAERNAYAKLIPAKFAAQLIEEKLKDKHQVIDVTPKEPTTPTEQPKTDTNTPKGWIEGPPSPLGPHQINQDLNDPEVQHVIYLLDNSGKKEVEDNGFKYKRYSVSGNLAISRRPLLKNEAKA